MDHTAPLPPGAAVPNAPGGKPPEAYSFQGGGGGTASPGERSLDPHKSPAEAPAQRPEVEITRTHPEPGVLSIMIKVGLLIITITIAGGVLVNIVSLAAPEGRVAGNPFPPPPADAQASRNDALAGESSLEQPAAPRGMPAGSPLPVAGGLRLDEPGAAAPSGGSAAGAGRAAGEDSRGGLTTEEADFGGGNKGMVVRSRHEPVP